MRSKKSYVRNCVQRNNMKYVTEQDIQFIGEEIREDRKFILSELEKNGVTDIR